MRTSTRVVMTAAFLAAAAIAPATAAAQEVAVGTWTGTIRNPPPRNAQPRPASLVVRKGADPHWRWRSGPKELLNVRFTWQQDAAEVSAIALNESRLTFSFTPLDVDTAVECGLQRQTDGSYTGECKGGTFQRLLTLNPPDPETAKEPAR